MRAPKNTTYVISVEYTKGCISLLTRRKWQLDKYRRSCFSAIFSLNASKTLKHLIREVTHYEINLQIG